MAGPYGSVGTDYRELQAPAQVDTSLPDNGAAQHAAALSNLFKQFEGLANDVRDQTEVKAGALAGAASGATGHPQYKQGFLRFTQYGQAFNNAATGQYAIEAEAQADDAAARLRVQANNNPETFRATFSARRDAVLKQAPALAVPMLTELYNKRLAEGLAAISGDQAQEQRTTQRQSYDVGIQRQISRVATLQGSDNPQDQLAAQDEQVKLSLMIDGGKNAGLYSEAEAQAMHVNSMRAITSQVFQTQFDRELTRPDGDPMGLLERFTQAHIANANSSEPQVLSEPEFQKLRSDAVSMVREWNLAQSMTKRDGKTAEELRFEAGDQKWTAMALRGLATERGLSDAVTAGDLKPETARSIRGLMLNGANQQPKSDPKALLELHTDPNFLDMSDQDIANYPGVNATDALKAITDRNRWVAGWEGTQQVKDAKNAITAALKVMPGDLSAMMDPDKKRAVMDATQDFVTRMRQLDPAHRDSAAMGVAQEVIKGFKDKETQSDIGVLQQSKQDLMKNHGPGSADEWNQKKLQQALTNKDQQIQLLQRQLSGK